ncbi:MAG: hypothetical protein IPN29_21860 [Saprospiraceae bacterium]|nr:hypothetical protein [Saprospiraceae bacterium]
MTPEVITSTSGITEIKPQAETTAPQKEAESSRNISDPGHSYKAPVAGIINTPGLMSADLIRANLLKEAQDRKGKSRTISDKEVEDLFRAYAQRLTSKSTRNAFLNTQIKLEAKTILVFVPTLFIKELVMQETDLMKEMRECFHIEDLIMKVEVDKSLFPEYEEMSAIRIKLSTRDIYQKMNEKNPALSFFVRTLGLKPEGE